ncbi:TIGR01906 family membrane protein [Sinomonas terrae]|uniref:TIGR01906 family membrane protein n=1 Tax=Sinomonas terrae TaxID=2908838 RepID=A0ABS9U371_9MICC|nr:TIGR01906 family membrane protein [Sinomonas terrae]MCH6471113.1 TIGR01906 family membrane protein [Sinomonas terrae]
MTEDRRDLEPEVNLDESQDTEEPAFDWMRTPERSPEAENPAARDEASGDKSSNHVGEHMGESDEAHDGGDVTRTSGTAAGNGRVPETTGHMPATNGRVPAGNRRVPESNGRVPESNGQVPAGNGRVPESTGLRDRRELREGSQTPAATREPAAGPALASTSNLPESDVRESDVRESGLPESDVRESGLPESDVRESGIREPSPTSALQMRPPEDEVRRRAAQREAAAQAKPVAPRVLQVLMAIFLPFLLLIAAVRVIATPAFLWLEYFRPGFPGDGYGFSVDDRLTYGSYAVDYLSNFAGRRYLGDLVQRSGAPLFTDAEVSHMADVKSVIFIAYAAGLVLLAFFVVAFLVLRKRPGAFGRGLFAGAIVTFVIVVGLAVLAFMGWEQFFTDFHRIFFSQGNWTFQLSDTLIRLFPAQFWMDSAIVIGVLTLLVSSLIIIFAWPIKRKDPEARPAAGRDEALSE